MIAIDLLPPEEARAAAAGRRARQLASLGAATAVLSVVLGHGALEVAAVLTQREIVRARVERAALERPVAALRLLRRRQAALRSRLAILERLEARGGERGTGPVQLLEALATVAPPQLCLTALQLTAERLELTGVAADERTIADFVARLHEVRPLRALDLEDAARDDRATPVSRRFVIAGRIGDAP